MAERPSRRRVLSVESLARPPRGEAVLLTEGEVLRTGGAREALIPLSSTAGGRLATSARPSLLYAGRTFIGGRAVKGSLVPSNDGRTGGPLRVFLSHTSEFRQFPADRSFVARAQDAVIRAAHAVTDMAYLDRKSTRLNSSH